MIIEIWRPIKGFDGYEVSNTGKVRSLNYLNKKGNIKELSHWIGKKGYHQVTLRKNNKNSYPYIHRLVAEAFIPNPENKPEVDHIIPVSNGGSDGADNLRWCTHKENTNNPISREKYLKNRYRVEWERRISIYKPTKEAVAKMAEKHKKPIGMYKDGKLIKRFDSAADAERENKDYKFMSISAACNGRIKTYRGYEWKFII